MRLDIGDDITYVLSVSRCEDRPVLWVWIDRMLDIKNCVTEIDKAALSVQDQSQTSESALDQYRSSGLPNFVSYRFTSLDFWRKTFDVRKQIWDA